MLDNYRVLIDMLGKEHASFKVVNHLKTQKSFGN